MGEEFQASKPIYMQIVDRISQQIIRKELSPGDKLPSVRDMAVHAGVNPNTIQRTYQELERMEVVMSKRGQGTFVTQDEEILLMLKTNMQNEIFASFVSNLKELGLSNKEMINGLEKYLREENK
ncbi:DNA-binding transcriptional regulator YhcF (GntR family) [Cytobacillus horneckiae]|uniref:GntR family transcriptional regulator n=1 Tax=Cytobacillus horneckiae TaxID=549687 RepID=A0A2N0ZI85_9BACI|nr:GntR family transcriptional regulator [Cytobacillus horneckiae]MBN6887815.1 GntR family transcriptional regulator [Cytobacillus horneckiae]MCM3179829.1 GntR family transcriptional regulator [Cytobacillus horneckiae]MEC1155217.1 GntR family transcriptional regulator [Cytobacillus horneckiae]MED2936730.1 GntR family transcriptional regulator [Cytobacillus horneckiae]PKG29204.1 GntR family transcriptional regulator [Cytobacillus horneckiae]